MGNTGRMVSGFIGQLSGSQMVSQYQPVNLHWHIKMLGRQKQACHPALWSQESPSSASDPGEWRLARGSRRWAGIHAQSKGFTEGSKEEPLAPSKDAEEGVSLQEKGWAGRRLGLGGISEHLEMNASLLNPVKAQQLVPLVHK